VAENRALLKGEGNALCAACHDTNEHSHALQAGADTEFASVPDDWPTDGGSLACAGCHLPHASASKRLFVGGRETLCKACHRQE
jgi:predicted CXXCH cytochrome family protein